MPSMRLLGAAAAALFAVAGHRVLEHRQGAGAG